MGNKQSVLCIAQVGVWGLGSHTQVPWSLLCLSLSWRSSLKAGGGFVLRMSQTKQQLFWDRTFLVEFCVTLCCFVGWCSPGCQAG